MGDLLNRKQGRREWEKECGREEERLVWGREVILGRARASVVRGRGRVTAGANGRWWLPGSALDGHDRVERKLRRTDGRDEAMS